MLVHQVLQYGNGIAGWLGIMLALVAVYEAAKRLHQGSPRMVLILADLVGDAVEKRANLPVRFLRVRHAERLADLRPRLGQDFKLANHTFYSFQAPLSYSACVRMCLM